MAKIPLPIKKKEEKKLYFSIDSGQEIPKLPDLKKDEIDIRYPLIPPYAYVHIYWDIKNKELTYEVEQPQLNSDEETILNIIEDGIKELINISYISVKNSGALIEYLEKNLQILLKELRIQITKETYLKLMYYIYRDFVGLNEIEPLLWDYFIEDIECNGTNQPIYIVHRKYRNIKTNIKFKSAKKLTAFVEKLAQKTGHYISYATPLLDGALPDGSVDYNEPFIYKEYNKIKICKIGRFVDKYYKKDEYNTPINVNSLEVPAFDKDMRIKWKKLDYVYRHKINEDLYKLKLEASRSVNLTGAHSVFVLRKNTIKPELVSNLKEGDYVVAPLTIPENNIIKEFNLARGLSNSKYSNKFLLTNIPARVFEIPQVKRFYEDNYKTPRQSLLEHRKKKILPIKLFNKLTEDELRQSKISTTSAVKIPTFLKVTKDLLRLFGYYYGEGWLTEVGNHHRIHFCFNKDENEYIQEVKDHIKKYFNCNSYVEPEEKNARKVVVNSILVYAVFEEVLKASKGAKNKEIPNWIYNIDKKLQKEFIETWINSDYGSTSSSKLANGISYLSLFNKKIVPFYDRERESTIKGRVIKSHEFYTNFYNRNETNFHTMIPIELFNPLNKIHRRLSNKRIRRERLKKILSEKRFERFNNLPNTDSTKFIKEWEKRGIIHNINGTRLLTKKGQDAMHEYNLVNKLIDSDLIFLKINKISRTKSTKEFVYDVSVPNCENFISGFGGVCCHNSRVNATFTEDISSKGPTFTIRKFTKTPWSPIALIQLGTVSPQMLAYLWMAIEYEMNVMIIGGTASGKTTLLNALTSFIPPQARVVSIEDSVTGDSKIIIKQENQIKNITIKEFVDNKIDAEIMTLDKKGNIIFTKPSNYIKHKVKKDIYEVLTATGRRIKVTQDHSLFTLKDKKITEVKPIDLQPQKSFIAVPRTLPMKGREIKEINLLNHLNHFENCFLVGKPIKKIFEKYKLKDFKIKKERYTWWKKNNLIKIKYFKDLNIKFTNEELKQLRIKSKNTSSIPLIFKITQKFLEFCGLWLGDGSYDNYNGNSMIISNSDQECRDIFTNIKDYIGANHSEMSDNGISQRIHSTVFYKFMKNVLKFDGYSSTKKIPNFILNLSNKQLKYFIRGYFSADGTMKKSEISCSSQSIDLLDDLQTLLLRLGIISRINDFNRKDKCMNMSISSSENIEKFKKIRFLQERKNKKLYSYNKQAHHTSSDIIPLETEYLKDIHENHHKLSWPYLQGMQNIGRSYLQEIAIQGSEYNDISHTDILWDKIKKVTKLKTDEIEVFDLSIPKYEKFLCNNIFVHNTRELNLQHSNWLPSVAREGVGLSNLIGQKYGEVSLQDLLKESFRQNPDYVIVGEIRGEEAYVLFQGMASGHPSFGTMHANSVDTMIKRLETPPINLSSSLVESMDIVCIMIQTKIKGKPVRKLKEIDEIIRVEEGLRGKAEYNVPFIWNPPKNTFMFKKESVIFNKLFLQQGIPKDELQREFTLRTNLLVSLYQRRVLEFDRVREIIKDYYKSPEQVLRKFKII